MTEKPTKLRRTHNQIANALKEEAQQRGIQANVVYNQFFREVFLHELMKKGSGWVLKGGTNVYCRIPGARQTKDLDIYRHTDPTSAQSAAELLVELMNGHRVGPYFFALTRTARKTMAGPIENERVKVTVLHGVANSFAEFSIDVSGDLNVSGEVEEVTVQSSFSLVTEFFPHTFQVTSYPIENQVADKIAAMYDRYGETTPGRASTRFHDLFDVALIAMNLPARADLLHDALEQQSQLRGVALPDSMSEPEPGWGRAYEEKARSLRWGVDELCDFEEALRVAGRLLNPVLAQYPKVRDHVWDPSALSWNDGS